MYPLKKNYQNAVLVHLYDEKNKKLIRTFWTQKPEMFLKMYTFMQEHDIDIDIDINYDKNDKDPYNDTIGTIKDITFSSGGTYAYNIIKIYIEVRDYR